MVMMYVYVVNGLKKERHVIFKLMFNDTPQNKNEKRLR